MAGILAVGEVVHGRPSRMTLELATLVAGLAVDAHTQGHVLLVAPDRGASDAEATAAVSDEVAAHGASVWLADGDPNAGPETTWLARLLVAIISARSPDFVLLPATPEGRDIAGFVVGLTELPILVSAAGVRWHDGRVVVDVASFGGRLATTSALAHGPGLIVVRPGAARPTTAPVPGAVEPLSLSPAAGLASVRRIEGVARADLGASVEEARVVVGGGRGAGGPDGFRLLADLAAAFDGAVGATRAAVDAGWADYGIQLGQTGKSVKPDLYVACGISGAIQHKVGVQTAGTIIAINRDADAPIAEFADLLVVGDLFEIVPRLTAALRARRG